MNSKVKLIHYLIQCGIKSRRALMHDIINGCVTINGHSCTNSGTIVNPNDTIKLNGKIVKAKTHSVYIAFHKPIGFECTHDKQKKHIYRFFNHLPYHVFSIGRLDVMTSGLLIVTNDGVFANKYCCHHYNLN